MVQNPRVKNLKSKLPTNWFFLRAALLNFLSENYGSRLQSNEFEELSVGYLNSSFFLNFLGA